MRVLVTGATGFLGQHVIAELRSRGIEVITLGRRPVDKSIGFIEADLLESRHLDTKLARVGASHLLHLAWFVEPGIFWNSPINLQWVSATTRLVEAFCAAGGQRVVAAGTYAEYDWSFGYCREDSTPLASSTLYGTAKDATRRLVMAICDRHEVACAWGRVFIPYGSGESAARLVPSLIAAFRGERAPFGVNTSVYRDFLHVGDVAAAFTVLLLADAVGEYNICSGQPARLEEIVRVIAAELGSDPTEILALPGERQGEPALLVGDCSKLKQLGWKPLLGLTDGLLQTIDEALR